MVVTASAPPPDGQLVITLPADALRGVMWFLDRAESDRTWTQFYAVNANPEGAPQRVYRLGDEPYEGPDLAVRGPGPDIVAIPDDIEPGTWRACPAGVELGCVDFEVALVGEQREVVVAGESPFSDGRSYVATTERTADDVRVGIDYPFDAGDSSARIDALVDGTWVPTGDVDPTGSAGRFVVAADVLGQQRTRLCLVALPPTVACILLPST